MCNHFHKGGCKNAVYTFQIFEKIDDDGRTARDVLDGSITSEEIVFHYGFNDRLGDGFIKEDKHVLAGSKFSALPRKSIRISRNHIHKLSTFLSPNKFSSELLQIHLLIHEEKIENKHPLFLTNALMLTTLYALSGI